MQIKKLPFVSDLTLSYCSCTDVEYKVKKYPSPFFFKFKLNYH